MQHLCGLHVSGDTQIIFFYYVRGVVESVHFLAERVFYHEGRIRIAEKRLFLEFAILEGLRGQIVDECIEALVHPGILSFIASYDHREPNVAKLVIGYSPKCRTGRFPTAKNNTRILHPSDDSGHVHGSGVGILEPFLGIMLDGTFDHFGGQLPSLLLNTLGRIDTHRHTFFPARQIDARRI